MTKVRPKVVLPAMVAIAMSLILGLSTLARRVAQRGNAVVLAPSAMPAAPRNQGTLSSNSSVRICPRDPTCPPNLCDAYFFMSQDVGGTVDLVAVAADRDGTVAADLVLWDGPSVVQRHYAMAPYDALYHVVVRFALSRDGRLFAGVMPAEAGRGRRTRRSDAECLGLLTTTSGGEISLSDTLLWRMMAIAYHQVAEHIAGRHSLDDDPILTNNYGSALYVLHSALTLYNPKPFPNTDQAALLWSPLGEQLVPYQGEVKRRFELNYEKRRHAFVYLAPRSGNPYEETNAGCEFRLEPEGVEWLRGRSHALDRYPNYVELRAALRGNWRYCQGHVSLVYAGEAMLATGAAEYPASGSNPSPELLILPEGVSLGIPSQVQRDPRLLGTYEETRAVMVDREISAQERQQALTVLQANAGEEVLAQTLRMMPVYCQEDGRFYTFGAYIQKSIAEQGLAEEGSPMERDPVGASMRIFFDPSPETIREMMGVDAE